jgi:hypothetical protein
VKSQNYINVNQHFILDAAMYNLIFYFLCSWR